MSRGIVLFGFNNSRVEYIRIAMIAATFVKKNMPGVPICLITDEWAPNVYPDLNDYFDELIFIKQEDVGKNPRIYRDTQYYTFKDEFRNSTRSNVYSLSPYDETLLIDCDYLVCNDTLNKVWGNSEEVMINKNAISLLHTELGAEEQRLNPFGIKMYWATVIYFRKGEKAKMLFDLVDHIKANWEFYKLTYEFPGNLFRNDYAFSIAIHMLNGFVEGDFAADLPDRKILTALDFDQFYGITDHRTLHFFINDRKEQWKFYATKVTGINVHCMNKISLLNNFTQIVETVK